jgi:hypothetical protein
MQMKNLSTWLLVMFMVMFWVFRMIVAITYELGIDFGGIVPLNMNLEIILLFVVLLAMVLIIKRKIIGALIYLLGYGMYFGVDLYNNVMLILEGQELAIMTYLNTFVSLIGMVIPIAVLFDLLADKNRKAHPVDKKTDWFYKNEDYDRKLDERADKNNYRTL